ncbi:HSP20 family protein [Krasilnikovia cinnamomea]|uniref:HSP20 family protein n=1 Tax=Krasilnikovia cinnamomea TaxID=349313 RepID=A0A4Q7ZHG1_9ACTN|nr:Hsp20/alpha crystallin family protein [Krasilnikovia cinnamomea]RZU49653.1 HSP20 family protein [Krasilnikovia cinnamomea]
MLVRTDPFRELDRWTRQMLGDSQPGTWSRPVAMPLDAYRTGDEFIVAFDLPGVTPDSIDIDIERNVLTVKAERRPLDLGDDAQLQASERPLGVFSRQLILSDVLDSERIQAGYDNGVLVLRIPVLEKAKPRKVNVAVNNSEPTAINA